MIHKKVKLQMSKLFNKSRLFWKKRNVSTYFAKTGKKLLNPIVPYKIKPRKGSFYFVEAKDWDFVDLKRNLINPIIPLKS